MNSLRLFDVPYHQQKKFHKDSMFATKINDAFSFYLWSVSKYIKI